MPAAPRTHISFRRPPCTRLSTVHANDDAGQQAPAGFSRTARGGGSGGSCGPRRPNALSGAGPFCGFSGQPLPKWRFSAGVTRFSPPKRPLWAGFGPPKARGERGRARTPALNRHFGSRPGGKPPRALDRAPCRADERALPANCKGGQLRLPNAEPSVSRKVTVYFTLTLLLLDQAP